MGGPFQMIFSSPSFYFIGQASSDIGEAFVLYLLIPALVIFTYFIPSYVASKRNASHTVAIFVVNLFLGWSLLGWVGALVWAIMSPEKSDGLSEADKVQRLEAKIQQLETGGTPRQTPERPPAALPMQYQISKGNNSLGYKTAKEISEMLIDGQLGLDDFYLDESRNEWREIRNIKNLDI